jgi:hypothetical protein
MSNYKTSKEKANEVRNLTIEIAKLKEVIK